MLAYRGRKIIPAPFVTINKSYNSTSAGEKLGVSYQLTLTGTLLPWRGSPSGNYDALADAFWTLSNEPPDESVVGNNEDFNHILRKQEAIRWLFSEDGRSLEWQPANGQPVVKCNPKILSINFGEGTWAERCTYQVTLQADWILINGLIEKEDSFEADLIICASEEWSFAETVGQQGEGYEVSHTVHAQGSIGYDENGDQYNDNEAWENAKVWVDARITGDVSTPIVSGALGSGTWRGGSYTKSVSIGESDGAYSVTEHFLLMPTNVFIEKDFQVSLRTDPESVDVSYNGTIYGLSEGERSGGSQAIINAKNNVPSNAQAKTDAESVLGQFLGDSELSDAPSDKSIVVNYKNGQVSFSFRWSASEDASYSATKEATLNYDASTDTYTITLTMGIDGTGDDAATRLANARTAIPSDAGALTIATNLIGEQMPSGILIEESPSRKGTVFNETRGSVRISYTWETKDSEYGDYQINISTAFPADVAARIPIPGRAEGPIIQDMNTVTLQVITVNLNKNNNLVKPDNATVVAMMDDAAGAEESWLLDDDRETWDIITKVYTRTRTYTVKE